ncbi:MAG: HEAT repeat domain-containing protein [Polyangiaceae bacterium]|nr:HEAT repeat domain-containing protein [Polyangiaceae bacterium]
MSERRRLRQRWLTLRVSAWCLSVCVLSAAMPAEAESLPIQERFGEAAIAKLLRSSESGERRRGFERLGLPLLPEVRERLLTMVDKVESLEPPEKRALVFSLAPFAAEPRVAAFLYRILSDASGGESTSLRQVQMSAALALSHSGSSRAIGLLLSALGHEGPLADIARTALLAHPPRTLNMLTSKTSPAAAVALVGELGSSRDLAVLRALVQTARMEVSTEAAVAMVKLGSAEPLGLARQWAGSSAPRLRSAAAEILARLAPAESEPLVQELLGREEDVELGLELAERTRSPRLATLLIQLLLKAPPSQALRVRRLIASLNSEEANNRLLKSTRRRTELALVAYALATAHNVAAERTLQARLVATKGWEQRLWKRALLIQSADPAEQDKHGFPTGSACLKAVSGFFATATASLPTHLQACLQYREVWSKVPTDALVELLEASGSAPLAALVLGARYNPQQTLFEQLLHSADADVRASALLGLAQSDEPSRYAWLTAAYASEVDPTVRQAIVTGMGLGSPEWAPAWFSKVAALDADARVRAIAEQALKGPLPRPCTGGSFPLWIFTEGVKPGDAIGVRIAPGLVLPVIPDADGFVVVPNAVPGPYSLRLAPPTKFKHLPPKSFGTHGS